MNYKEALDFMYACLPFFQKTGDKAYKPGFGNILKLCQKLGNPQNAFKSIHVAGTNGKGSSSHMLAAILQKAGYKTGLYTSPHLKSFTERIKINGIEVEEEFIAQWITTYQSVIEEIQPSFFEVTVALAFDYFAKQNIDIAIVETGLGGRLDATNIILPEVALITNIGLDHVHILGNNLPEIASEKAGIIKENVPVVISESQSETDQVFINKASSLNVPISFADKAYEILVEEDGIRINKNGKLLFNHLAFSLPGEHQFKNLQGVLQTIDILNSKGDFIIKDEDVEEALIAVQNITGLKGRWQTLQENPLVICDVGHNEEGLKVVASQLRKVKYEKLHIVFGMLKEKNAARMLSHFPSDAIFYFCKPDNDRAVEVDYLSENAKKLNLNHQSYISVKAAVQTAKQNAGITDMIFIGGSNFVVAEIEEL
ncbi:bifunctional folylpolyglutamate synthase/dihydrofolate synthase [Chondrinema litorale]|uniref:bifunctional folylpolyglutamate synthase/dihydrofolate synthase n=1 Tax=Chondrinema litorale TaxID=2994555 RepID=UPI0025435613|nr:folylpolyglutamate synthase/dihydrofolate synthase family protein [Chondrinema litorale]UZR94825.1 bifunctional folylpolyglutamate synthase/dihydrofolate synthase [Chondrinema litorale]